MTTESMQRRVPFIDWSGRIDTHTHTHIYIYVLVSSAHRCGAAHEAFNLCVVAITALIEV